MSETSDGQKPKGHRAARRERNKAFEKTVIKTGLQKFCKEPSLIELIERAVRACSQVSIEASLLVSFHLLRCLQSGITVGPLEQNFWNQCIAAIANGEKGIAPTASPELQESFRLYVRSRPPDYVPVKREGYMSHIFEGLRETMLVNYHTVFSETFSGRLCKWLRLQILLSDRDDLKQNSVIKSAVALLNRACTDETGSVTTLHPAFLRLAHLSQDDLQWLQKVTDGVRTRIGGPLPINTMSPEYIHQYFSFFASILSDIEQHLNAEGQSFRGIKAFSMLPQKKFRAPFIHISTTVLKALVTALRGRKKKKEDEYSEEQKYLDYLLEWTSDDELWREFFDLKRVVKGKKQFAGSVKTDGISVSITVEVPRKSGVLPSKGAKRKKAVEKLEKEQTAAAKKHILEKCRGGLPERAIAIDPGVKAPFTGVVYHPDAMETLGQPHGHNSHFETVRWSAGKYYKECGIAGRTREMRHWTNAAPSIKQFNETVATAKTASLDQYSVRVAQVLTALPRLLDFYVYKRRVRRSRWFAFMQKQRATEHMISDVTATRTHRDQKEVLIAYGNAAMNNMRGCQPVVQKALRRKLASRCMLIDVCEFRTSRLCCCCLRAMEGKLQNGERSHGVRCCENNTCPRIFWNRDINAAINILQKCLRFLRQEEDPPQFSRHNAM